MTSMSRIFSCRVRLASRREVISFCRELCCALASAFACLYLDCFGVSEEADHGGWDWEHDPTFHSSTS